MSKTVSLFAIFILGLSLAACGSTTEDQASESSQKMPDVVGQSLTSAMSTLDEAGIAWQASSEAAAADSDSYDVCATVPAAGLDAPAGDAPAKLKVAKSFECEKSESPAAKSADEEASSEESASDSAPSESASGKIKVPNVVGKSHQFGQDTMQEAGLYNLSEEDATGEGRLLLVDRNWVVVRQRPKAGSMVNEDATITLYSKKYTD